MYKIRPSIVSLSLALLCTSGVVGCKKEMKPPATEGEVVEEIRTLSTQKKYEEATRIGLAWLEKEPNDAVMHGEVALLFSADATVNTARRPEFINESLHHADSAVQLQPNDAAILREAATVYEIAGDLAPEKRCTSYNTVVQLLDRYRSVLTPELSSTDPIWTRAKIENETSRARVQAKLNGAHCK